MVDILLPPLGPMQTSVDARLGQKGTPSAGSKDGLDSAEKENRDLKKACEEMEAQFIYYLFKEMRNTVPENGFIPKGSAEKMYTAMLDTHMAEDLSRKGGIGLADVIYRQLTESADDSGSWREK